MDDEKQEFLEERQHMLLDLLRSSAWRDVARVALVQKCRDIQKRLAEGGRLEVEKIRDLQSQYLVLTQMVDDEKVLKFFLGG